MGNTLNVRRPPVAVWRSFGGLNFVLDTLHYSTILDEDGVSHHISRSRKHSSEFVQYGTGRYYS